MRSTRMKQVRKAPIIHLLSEVSIPTDVISFGQGIPFFGPPKTAVSEVEKNASQPKGFTYSTDQGFFQLRSIIAEKLKKEQDVRVDPETQIMVTAGANQAFMNALLAITRPGDEIIFFTPTYFNYVMAAKMIGCKPVFSTTDKTFQPDISDLKNKITKRTKAIVTISPNNPTGAVYPPSLLNKINALCADHSLFHISDEVYEYFVYDDATHTSPLRFDSMMHHTISLFSLSKSFSLSGYRIGYMVFPENLFDELLKAQDTIGIAAPSPSQFAAQKAIPLGNTHCKKFFSTLENNRKYIQKEFSKHPLIETCWTKGAYYFFFNLNTTQSSWSLAKKLIENYKIIILPGEMFDVSHPAFRLSYGNLSEDGVKKGLHRLSEGLEQLC